MQHAVPKQATPAFLLQSNHPENQCFAQNNVMMGHDKLRLLSTGHETLRLHTASASRIVSATRARAGGRAKAPEQVGRLVVLQQRPYLRARVHPAADLCLQSLRVTMALCARLLRCESLAWPERGSRMHAYVGLCACCAEEATRQRMHCCLFKRFLQAPVLARPALTVSLLAGGSVSAPPASAVRHSCRPTMPLGPRRRTRLRPERLAQNISCVFEPSLMRTWPRSTSTTAASSPAAWPTRCSTPVAAADGLRPAGGRGRINNVYCGDGGGDANTRAHVGLSGPSAFHGPQRARDG